MKHTRLTFAAFVVLMVGLGSSDSLRGIFSPVFSSHFALSATQLGLIVTVSYIGNLVFLLVGGNVIERFEKKKALLALTGIWMAALAVFAFTDNYYLLLAGMFCAMGASTLLNTTLNLVTPLLFASSPAFFVNLLFFTQGIGTSGSQSLLGRYATDIGFWHKTNLVLLALGAAAVLLLAFSTVPGPRADGPHPAKRQSGVLKNRAALPLVFVFGFYFIAEHGVMNWLVAYATSGLGMEQAKASNYLAVFFGGVMLGRLVLSPLVDRLGILKSMGVFGSLSAVLYIAGVVGGAAAMPLWAASGFFLSILYPTLVMSIRLFFRMGRWRARPAPSSVSRRCLIFCSTSASAALWIRWATASASMCCRWPWRRSSSPSWPFHAGMGKNSRRTDGSALCGYAGALQPKEEIS